MKYVISIVLQNVELPNAELQNVENTKRRITKCRKLQKVEKQKDESNKTLKKAENKGRKLLQYIYRKNPLGLGLG